MREAGRDERVIAEGHSLAIAALILGIASLLPFFCGMNFFFGIGAILCAAFVLKGAQSGKYGLDVRPKGTAGLILGIVGIVVGLFGWVVLLAVQILPALLEHGGGLVSE